MIAAREYRKWGVSLKLMVAVVAFVVAIVAFASDQKIWSGYWGDAVFNNEPTSVLVDAPAFANKIDADVDAMIEKTAPLSFVAVTVIDRFGKVEYQRKSDGEY